VLLHRRILHSCAAPPKLSIPPPLAPLTSPQSTSTRVRLLAIRRLPIFAAFILAARLHLLSSSTSAPLPCLTAVPAPRRCGASLHAPARLLKRTLARSSGHFVIRQAKLNLSASTATAHCSRIHPAIGRRPLIVSPNGRHARREFPAPQSTSLKVPQIPHCLRASDQRPSPRFFAPRAVVFHYRSRPSLLHDTLTPSFVPRAHIMAMAVNNRQQPQPNTMGYDHLRYPAPHFTNPWVSAPTAPPSQMYPTPLASNASALDKFEGVSQQQVHRPTSLSLPFHNLPVTAPSLGSGISLSDGPFGSQNLLDASQDLLNPARMYPSGYSSTASPNTGSFAPTSAPQYPMDYSNNSRSPYAYQQDPARRSSHPSVSSADVLESPVESQRQRPSSLVDFSSINSQSAQRNSFSDALDASRGMVAMSQDITPRNIYGNQGGSRSSSDSYGFPPTHSAHSSISSASTYPSYYNGSVAESSVTDYSSASESVEPMTSRTLPRPSALIGTNLPPAPQSMMGQFSSKVSSSSQKKHKCKICDKRFTRPSSLQTHMYSHTGEKRRLTPIHAKHLLLTRSRSIRVRSRRLWSSFFSRLESQETSQSPQGRTRE
jgi:hypothetical protein